MDLDGDLSLPFPFPAVVKPVRQGSSIGITTHIADREGLRAALDRAFALDDRLLVEEQVPGPELTVAVLQKVVLPIVEIEPKAGWFDFERKYTKGMTEYHVPARISEELTKSIQSIAGRVAELCGCEDMCRIDVMAGDDRGPRVLEVNTIPGFTGTSLLPMAAASVGISFGEVCERLVSAARLRN